MCSCRLPLILITGPILDPLEFAARFSNGDPEELGDIGRLICLVLSTWAASFGVNEKGEPERHTGYDAVKLRRERTNAWVHELLRMVDHYGLLRRPTWDGVQVLLLLLPLTEGMFASAYAASKSSDCVGKICKRHWNDW